MEDVLALQTEISVEEVLTCGELTLSSRGSICD